MVLQFTMSLFRKIMRLTPNYSIEEGVILMGGQVIDWVGNFKFLGVIISGNGTYDEHYKNRKKLFFSGLAEVNKLGFSKPELSTKIKALLYTALVRSKLVYGFETINTGKKNILGNLESNLIKNSYQLSKHSKTKILMYAMHISPMETYLLKRKINFLRQLANNESTADLLFNRCHNTLEDIIEYLDIDSNKDYGNGREKYLAEIMKRCSYRIKEILSAESMIKKCALVRSIRYLLNNRNTANDDTTQFLLDPRRFKAD
jgi:hypothetical protein